MTNYHAKFFAHALTKDGGSGVERLTQALLNASVDLNPHQVEAALYALSSSNGALLADEVGLGKTIEAGLVLCQLWAERKRKLLILCPASLRKQWQCELEEKFNLPVQIIDSKSYKELYKQGWHNPYAVPKICVSSYQYAAGQRSDLAMVDWDCVVIDEAHKLRNSYRPSNKVGQALRAALKDSRKLLLSATPLQNSINELYGIATLLDSTYFGDFPTFRARYTNANGNLDELRVRIKEFCWRTLRSEVQAYVRYTDRIAATYPFESSDMETRLYEDVSSYLQDNKTYAFPSKQRTMLTLIVRKVMASSTTALIGTLESIRARLLALKNGAPEQDSNLIDDILRDEPDMQKIITEDNEDLKVIAVANEVSDNVEIPLKKEEPKRNIEPEKLENEIGLVTGLINRAKAIGVDTKTNKLLIALCQGWEALRKNGAQEKAVIFTESRRSLTFLKKYLEDNGYAGQVVCFSGGGQRDDASEVIYRKYRDSHPEDASSKDVMMRHALINEFRNNAKILIATEAGAEGINLQFCSMVVNYDLPWNPQRVEQRIGRCHRYGQKHDVVVVNFYNKRNAADVRVFELLNLKFNLFEGLFGASNDVLGFVDKDGRSFERRIQDILDLCRTPQEIEEAFDKLRDELQEQIDARNQATYNAVIENLDDDVRRLLKINPEYAGEYLSEGDQRFIDVTKCVLADCAEFNSEKREFSLIKFPETYTQEVGLPKIALGVYSYDRNNSESTAMPYRPNSLLGEWVLNRAKLLDTPYKNITFDISSFQGRIAVLEQLRGKSGVMLLERLVLKSIESESFLLFSALCDDGSFIEPDIAEKMFKLYASETFALPLATNEESMLTANAHQYAQATANKVGEANNETFRQASEKLERWADDQIAAATNELKSLNVKKQEAQRNSRQAPTLDVQLACQREIRELTRKISVARANVFAVEDEVEQKRDNLLDELQRKLVPEIARERLFTIRWNIV